MSKYYNSTRTRNIYDPKSKETFKLSRSRIEGTLKKIKKCLDGKMPKADPECDYCNYLKAVGEVENDIRQSEMI